LLHFVQQSRGLAWFRQKQEPEIWLGLTTATPDHHHDHQQRQVPTTHCALHQEAGNMISVAVQTASLTDNEHD
jgi:hypothetical protein